jgi:tetratricopeptide (TPR) repeat protein
MSFAEMSLPTDVSPDQIRPAMTPKQVLAAFNHAHTLQQQGDIAASERVLRTIEASAPANAAVFAALAHNAKARGDLNDAEKLLRNAIRLEPQEPIYLNQLASILLNLERPTEAEYVLKTALTIKPTFLDAIFNLGRVFEELHLADAAVECFSRYARAAPKDAKGYARLGANFLHQGKFQEAMSWFNTASEHGAASYDLHYFRACTLAELGQFEEALNAHRFASAIAPNRFEARKGIANCLRSLGDHDGSLQELLSISQQWPEKLDIHLELNRSAWAQGRQDLFLKSYSNLRHRNALSVEHMMQEASMLMRAERRLDAIDVMSGALKSAPNRSDVHGMLATCLSDTSTMDHAVKHFDIALDINPQNVSALQNYSFALLSNGRQGESIPLLKRALVIDPQDQLALAGLSIAFRAIGDPAYERLVNFRDFVRHSEIKLPAGYSSSEEFNHALVAQLNSLHTEKVNPIDQTLRNGTQTPGSLFAKATGSLSELQEALRDTIQQYVSDLPFDPEHAFLRRKLSSFAFSGSWSCRLQDGGFHTNHVHNHGWISSAYYAALPLEVSGTNSAKSGWLSFGQSNLSAGKTDIPENFVRPAVGTLVLFPSYFWHGTLPFSSDDHRITVAFDVIPKTI